MSRAARVGHRALEMALHGLARLPLSALHGLSSVMAPYVGRLYRRRLVTKNLTESFPEMSPKEIARVRRRFYRNFTDQIFETVKLLHISDQEMRERMEFVNVELADRYLRQGRTVVAYFCHCGNWEWVPSITRWSSLRVGLPDEPDAQATFCQVYRPLRDQWFDRLMLSLRARFGSVGLPKRVAFLDLMRLRRQGRPTMTGFMSDQKPSGGDPGHVVNFLNHPTRFISGTETLARRMDAAVVYYDMERTGRGRYRVTLRPVTDSPVSVPDGWLTARYASLLSQTIRRDPSLWLWTHNRWKFPVTNSGSNL